MKTINLHQVDAFTTEKFGGNPAGVVTNADGLSDQLMQQVAREMNLSETAFVLSPTEPDATLKLRFFTPAAAEIDFCGHATIAALFQLARLQLFGLGNQGTNDVRVETNAGVLPMSVLNEEASPPRIVYTAPKTNLKPYRVQGNEFADEFRVSADLIDPKNTILIDTVLNYVYVPTPSTELLQQEVFDFARIREKSGKENIIVFCFFALKNASEKPSLQARGLAPNVGVDEDPFTGSMQAGLVLTAKKNGFIDQNQTVIDVEQGQSIGRPGSAVVAHDLTADSITVTASAVPIFSTQMEV